MEYYKILNLTREPFSNSPEPDFFYESPHHVDCLQKLELAIRVRRGLNVVIGEVGTGKTTLSRQLIRKFAKDEQVATHLLLDPHFSTEREFLVSVAEMFGLAGEDETAATNWQLRESIKKHLFEEAVEKARVVVLIIDEGQKIPDFCLEILREFLNYETNEYKLLQIVIFAQEEFRDILKKNPGFADRVNLNYNLGPLNFRDTRAMVLFRIERAKERGKEIPLQFTWGAMREIYRFTGGYPRKIVKLCHQVLLALIIQNKKKARRSLVKSIGERGEAVELSPGFSWSRGIMLAGLLLILLLIVFDRGYMHEIMPERIAYHRAPVVEKEGDITSKKVTVVSLPIPLSVEQEAKAPVVEKQQDAEPAQVASEPYEKHVSSGEEGALPQKKRSTAVVAVEETEQETTQSPAVDAAIVKPRSTYPTILGQVKVAENTRVWLMAEDIYGRCNFAMMSKFAEANPHIKNLNVVVKGDIVKVPSISATPGSINQKNTYSVEVGNTANIEKALAALRLYRNAVPHLRLLAYWNEEEGVRFAVMLKEKFPDAAAAQQAIAELPPDMAANGKVVGEWKPGTVFFTAG